MYDRGARDWVSRQRLGFHGTDLLETFNPDWHHIFPKAYLRKAGIPAEHYEEFLHIRASALAEAGTAYFSKLAGKSF